MSPLFRKQSFLPLYLALFLIGYLPSLYYAQCSINGFSFDSISASNGWQSPWSPPGDPNPQTLSYSPCGATPNGCGGSPPPTNQCYNLPQCCVVCQSWMQDTGPAGACLGLQSKFLGGQKMSETSVQLTFGGGDVVDTTPRQVNIVINCDPTATALTFNNFEAPSPSDPPPPYYLYILTLHSSTLCKGGLGGPLSGGTYFIIILFVGAALYVGIGVAVNRFHFQKEGIELIPNVEFWKETPGYLSDGVMFAKDKIVGLVKGQQNL